MEKRNKATNKDFTQYPIDPSAPFIKGKKYSASKGEQDTHKAQESGELVPKSNDIKFFIENEKSIQPVIANIISFIGVMVSAILFYYTYLLFTETKKATKSAQESAEAARNTFYEQKINDSIMRGRDSANAKFDSINTSKRFSFDSLTLQNQINEFIKLNSPLLQLDSIFFNNLVINENLSYHIQIISTGTTPIEIIKIASIVKIDSVKISVDGFRDKSLFRRENVFVNSNHPYQNNFESGAFLIKERYDMFVNNKFNFYVRVEIEYKNTLTGNFFMYKFQVQFKSRKEENGKIYGQLIENTNIPIIKKE